MLRRVLVLWAAVACGVLTACNGGDTNGTGASTSTGTTSSTGTGGGSSAVCGDGQIGAGEACDDGNTTDGDGCGSTCFLETGWDCSGTPTKCKPVCGDGVVLPVEKCDDGNTKGGDGCSATCIVEAGYGCDGAPSVCTPDQKCGNGKKEGSEKCDDGNTKDGDGCSAKCAVEAGYACNGAPSVCAPVCGDGQVDGAEKCDDGNTQDGDGCSAACAVEAGYDCDANEPSTCTPICGDGVVNGAEECDDGNTADADGCSASCGIEAGFQCAGAPSACVTICGDGLVMPSEACDDGNTADADGCSASCAVEAGYQCAGAPSACAPICGDGLVVGAEKCDDGNTADADGCSASCVVEAGFQCAGAPSACAPICGDGVVVLGEACDDKNTTNGDGCSASCKVEPGFQCTGAPSTCATVCGDGTVAGAEACDDKNTTNGDGCSASCLVEAGWNCTGTPSSCAGVCGDGLSVGAEKCDDGNTTNGDCCSSGCQIEAGCEIEPNDTIAQANDFAAIAANGKVKAFIEPAADVDLFKVVIPAGKTGGITAQTLDGPLGTTCASNNVDTQLRLLDAAGTALGTDDDSGAGYCSLLARPGLAAGTYYVEVVMSPNAGSSQTFDYTLDVALAICGDGSVQVGEQCDDGNNTSGDGCSAACKLEPKPETEPNDACGTANGPYAVTPAALMSGTSSTTTDADFFAITLSAYTDLRVETFDSTGPGACATIDTIVQAFNGTCTSLGASNDEGGINSCSLLDPTLSTQAFMRHLAPGTYYIKVTPYSFAPVPFNYTVLATAVATCGNGVKEGSEECDGGAGCQADCLVVPVCGDGIKSAGEQCDDKNTTNGDGCSSTCQLELHPEVEPNDACGTATGPFAVAPSAIMSGTSTTTTDADFFAITLSAYTDLRVETFDSTGPGSCASIDTVVQAFNGTCTSLGASDDEGGINSCSLLDPTVTSQAFMRHLAPGTYYIKVTPYAFATVPFNYTVQATAVATCGNGVKEGSEECDGGATCQADCLLVPVCGDGKKSGAEECDDGNTTSGDGCSATCVVEATAEVEPNGTPAEADTAMAAITGSTRLKGGVSASTDKDLFKLTVAAQTVVRFEVFNPTGADCTGMTATTMSLLSSAGTTLKTYSTLDNGGIGVCAGLVVNLDPGTYYVQIGAGAAIPMYVLEVKYEANDGAESEANDSRVTADVTTGTDFFVCGSHQSETDLDVFAVDVPAGKSIRAEIVEVASTATGYKTCESNTMDTYLTLYSPSGTSLLTDDDGGRGYCSGIDGTGSVPLDSAAHNLAAGTYYLEVKSSSYAAGTSDAQFEYCLAVTIR